MKKFTAIELIVILAVMSVLVTLIIPSLKVAKDKTVAAACKANLNQTYILSSIYTKENDGYYMTQKDSLYSNHWQNLLNDTQNNKVFLCPEVKNLHSNHTDESYGLSLILKDQAVNFASSPSITLMFGDGEKYLSLNSQNMIWWKPNLERHSLKSSDLIHNSRMNITFLDGAVDHKDFNQIKQSEPLWKF